MEDLEGGFFLPNGQKPFNLTSVGYGALNEGDLFGRKDAMHEAPVFPAAPLVIGAMPGGGIGGASADGLAANFRS